jgi:hypothetical protein
MEINVPLTLRYEQVQRLITLCEVESSRFENAPLGKEVKGLANTLRDALADELERMACDLRTAP